MSDFLSTRFPPATAPAAPAVKAKGVAPTSTPAPAPAPAPAPVKASSIDPQDLHRQLEDAVSVLNKQMEHTGTSLSFSVDEALGRSIVKVVNKDSGELVRQIPGEDVVRVARSIESLKGVLYNKSI